MSPDVLPPEAVALIGDRLLTAFRADLRDDPSAYGFRDAASSAAARLATLMDERGARSWKSPVDFVADVTREVAGEGATVADSAVRRACVAAGRQVTASWSAGTPLPSDLWCDLYRLFFAHSVAAFLQSVIAEHINAAVPVLPVVDPSGQIAHWIAGRLLALVPNPCQEAAPGEGLSAAADRLIPMAINGVLHTDVLWTGEKT